MKLLVATSNKGKLREIREVVGEGYDLLSLGDFPGLMMPEENGATFEDNARIKAVGASLQSGELTLAEDSGIEVDALDRRPGVFSARFAGEGATDKENNAKLLAELGYNPKRSARYRCIAVLAREGKVLAVEEGACEGEIALAPQGSGGFGYDPLFVPQGYDLTMAELSPEEKNALSHRGQALRKIKQDLKEVFR